MWHEARKHERKIRGMIVDYKKRAERRREFYEKIRRDPAQFLQIHGRLAKIHVDASISSAAENCLVPWHGDENNTIDRFDVRAHLDSLDFGPPQPATKSDKRENDEAERRINYERWRNLIQNEFLGISEARCLHQIWLEERYGGNQSEETTTQKKKKAVFAYNYENPEETRNSGNEDELSEDGTDSEEDIDSSIDIKTLTADQVIRMNGLAAKYDLMNDDFIRFAEEDLAEAERIRIAKALESEKSMFSGRKSRRERRALKERCMLIVRANNVAESLKQTQGSDEETASKVESSSQSEDSEVEERKIEFITSFGGSSEDESKIKSKKKSTVKTSKKKTKSSKPVAVVEPAPAVEFGPSMPPEIEEKLFGPTKESSPSPGFSPRRSTLYRSKSRSPIRPDPRSVYGWKRRSPSSPSSLSSFEKSRRRSRSGSRRRSSHHRSSRRSNSRTRSRVSHKDDKSSSSESIPSRYRIRKSRSRSRSRSRSYSRHRRRYNGRKRSRNHRSRSRSHSTRRRRSSSSSSSSPHRSRRRSKSRSRGRSPRYSSSHKHRHHRHRRRSSSNKPTSSRHSRRSSKEPKRRRRSSSNSSSSRSSSHESLTFKYKRDRIISSKNISGHSSSDENSKKKPNSIPQLTKHDDVPKGGDPTSVASNPSVPPLRKYYRDDLDEDSDSSLSVDESSSSRKPPQIEPSKSNSTKAGVSSVKSSADRLKRKTQALLERQCKLDKAQERKRR